MKKNIIFVFFFVLQGIFAEKYVDINKGAELVCNDNLRLRTDGFMTGEIITSMMKGTKVKVLGIGKPYSSDGVDSNWAFVEIQAGGKDKDGNPIKEGTKGWCFGGFLDGAKIFVSAVKKSAEIYEMVQIPEKDYMMGKTEVTQCLYNAVMGYNPSKKGSENHPVENVSWSDVVFFCNKLSLKHGYQPVYCINAVYDVEKWGYTPGEWDEIDENIKVNSKANGYRLPTEEEWIYAAKGGENYKYSGSDNIDEIAWYWKNSKESTHSVAQKKANGYGLYDMTGNVLEFCWDLFSDNYRRCIRGGAWSSAVDSCEINKNIGIKPYTKNFSIGFRLVRSVQ